MSTARDNDVTGASSDWSGENCMHHVSPVPRTLGRDVESREVLEVSGVQGEVAGEKVFNRYVDSDACEIQARSFELGPQNRSTEQPGAEKQTL